MFTPAPFAHTFARGVRCRANSTNRWAAMGCEQEVTRCEQLHAQALKRLSLLPDPPNTPGELGCKPREAVLYPDWLVYSLL